MKFTIIIGRKDFSKCITQSNYLIIQTKLLTTLFKNITLKQKNIASLLKHKNDFF